MQVLSEIRSCGCCGRWCGGAAVEVKVYEVGTVENNDWRLVGRVVNRVIVASELLHIIPL